MGLGTHNASGSSSEDAAGDNTTNSGSGQVGGLAMTPKASDTNNSVLEVGDNGKQDRLECEKNQNNGNDDDSPMKDATECLLLPDIATNLSGSLKKSNKPRLRIKIRAYRPVACWHWDVDSENCAICQLPFDACCPDCTRGGDDCPPVWGMCSHSYHMHCIMKWLSDQSAKSEGQGPEASKGKCPICRAPWEFKKGGT